MAALLGVDVDRTISLTFVMGAALAAVAGLMFMIYYGVVNFNDGFVPGVKAFTAAVLGGIGSLPGAVLGGLLIGLIETLWSAYFSIDYKDVATFSDPGDHAGVHALRAARQAGRGKGVGTMAVDAAEPRPMAPATAPARIAAALKDALGTALLALGLAVPILALRTEQNMSNELILQPRWGYVAIAVLLAFAARLALPPGAQPARRAARVHPPRAAWAARCPSSCCILLLLYPMLALAITGKAGAVKWIDNFGIQILIYIMLGWGLNIVVGLAGLLDLGYVAFYAVGAYAYALLATSAPIKAFMAEWVGAGFWPLWAFWICLPVAGLMAAFWGILLGFPVLRLQRRLSRHRHARLRRDHPPRADQLGDRSPTAMPASPAFRAPPSSACRSTTATRALPPSSAWSSPRSTAPSSCST